VETKDQDYQMRILMMMGQMVMNQTKTQKTLAEGQGDDTMEEEMS